MTRKFSEQELRNIAKSSKGLYESSTQILKSASARFSLNENYDIFLSHSYKDAEVIHGLKIYIESNFNLTVFVDWIEAPELDRTSVTKETADRLRNVMGSCKTLLVAHSESSTESKWVPWEVGYFDSINGRIAVMPITVNPNYSEEFTGQEYLGLYSYGVHGKDIGGKEMIWIQNNPTEYVSINSWVSGKEPSLRGA